MIIDFGKYSGKDIKEIYQIDAKYFVWLFSKSNTNKQCSKELKEACKAYFDKKQEIERIDKEEYDSQVEYFQNLKTIYNSNDATYLKEKREPLVIAQNIFEEYE